VDFRIIGHLREQARNRAMQQQDPNDENRQTARGAMHRASVADVSARRLTQITHYLHVFTALQHTPNTVHSLSQLSKLELKTTNKHGYDPPLIVSTGHQ
jgi:hypothetical protein